MELEALRIVYAQESSRAGERYEIKCLTEYTIHFNLMTPLISHENVGERAE
jgi:hypothetical protein